MVTAVVLLRHSRPFASVFPFFVFLFSSFRHFHHFHSALAHDISGTCCSSSSCRKWKRKWILTMSAVGRFYVFHFVHSFVSLLPSLTQRKCNGTLMSFVHPRTERKKSNGKRKMFKHTLRMSCVSVSDCIGIVGKEPIKNSEASSTIPAFHSRIAIVIVDDIKDDVNEQIFTHYVAFLSNGCVSHLGLHPNSFQ